MIMSVCRAWKQTHGGACVAGGGREDRQGWVNPLLKRKQVHVCG